MSRLASSVEEGDDETECRQPMKLLGPGPTQFVHTDGNARTTIDLQLKLVTPMLGGGIEAGVSDTTNPFRASAIRGLLRWWWRATRGAALGSSASLFAEEQRIWGSTSQRSTVIVEVLEAQLAPGVDALREEQGRKYFEQPAYALFSAQSEVGVRKIHKSGSFRLRISCPEADLHEVETALRTWIWFGGVGARTRRGLGSLVATSDVRFQAGALAAMLKSLPKPAAGAAPNWSMIPEARYVLGAKASPIQAWTEVVNLYRGYRQNRREGQTGTNRPGRSYWPEPDAIRRLRKTSSARHSTPVTEGNVFLRGQLGLPIVFHFKDPGDPQDNTLELSSDSDRMASPVITKALAINEREAYPLLLTLRTPAIPEKLVLRQNRAQEVAVDSGNVDAIEYLLQTAERDWNTKRRTIA